MLSVSCTLNLATHSHSHSLLFTERDWKQFITSPHQFHTCIALFTHRGTGDNSPREGHPRLQIRLGTPQVFPFLHQIQPPTLHCAFEHRRRILPPAPEFLSFPIIYSASKPTLCRPASPTTQLSFNVWHGLVVITCLTHEHLHRLLYCRHAVGIMWLPCLCNAIMLFCVKSSCRLRSVFIARCFQESCVGWAGLKRLYAHFHCHFLTTFWILLSVTISFRSLAPQRKSPIRLFSALGIRPSGDSALSPSMVTKLTLLSCWDNCLQKLQE